MARFASNDDVDAFGIRVTESEEQGSITKEQYETLMEAFTLFMRRGTDDVVMRALNCLMPVVIKCSYCEGLRYSKLQSGDYFCVECKEKFTPAK